MKNQWLMIHQLDKQLKEWQQVNHKYGRPRSGWIKTLRVALSMSAEQLADRLGLTRGRINQLENGEANNAVTLRTLNEVANALGCELIYAIVPKGHTTLKSIIEKRADQLAKEKVARVAHSMSLEEQSVDLEILQMQKDEFAKNSLTHLNKKFWPKDQISSLAEAVLKGLQKHDNFLQKISKKDPAYMEKLKECLMRMQNNNIIEPDLLNKLNQPEYANALKKALSRYQDKEKQSAP